MKIRFTSTSYLPPRNNAWKKIESSNQIKFGEYGDWSLILPKDNKVDILIWNIF